MIEVGIFAAGLWIYPGMTRAQDAIGRYAFLALIPLVFSFWVSSLFAGAPPDTRSLAWGAASMWIMVPWGWCIEKHRAFTVDKTLLS